MKTTLRRVCAGLLLVGVVIAPSWVAVAPPSDAVVTGMLAMWLHGTAAQIESPERLAQVQRFAFHTRIEGNPNTGNWLHFPITTPVVGTYVESQNIPFTGFMTNYRRYHLDKVFVSFRSGSADARVTNIHVYDGPKLIAAFDNLNLYGEQHMREFVLPDFPEVEQGICISLGVQFGSSGQRWMELQSVGADFIFLDH
ncbi:MAG: hypothetical protein NTY63_00825 [Candidatus Bipolaricaulota bacterium]|nr:hypothetical protein [Candidatus Bipolaricaulota bacterium]